MSMDDIEKLRHRVEKNPTSRLFLPLAEEYRKEGFIDEAVDVLLSGLERHPAYASARVALGKIYLDKGMVNEARNEFEQVVAAIPDNLFAQRKLADIYKEQGKKEEAIQQYMKVLELNPLDDEARISLRDLEGEPIEEPRMPGLPETTEEKGIELEEAPGAPFTFETVEEEPRAETTEETSGAGDAFDKEFEAFRSTFGETVGAEGVGHPDDIFALSEEEPMDTLGEMADEAVEEAVEGETAAAPEEKPTQFDAMFGDMFDTSGKTTVSESESALEDVEMLQGGFEAAEAETYFSEAVAAGEAAPASDVVAPDLSLGAMPEAGPLGGSVDTSAADALVAGGSYYRAVDAYRGLLKHDPDNKQILQRLSELKALLKMIGKEGDVVIERLEAFLDGIKRRAVQRL